MIPRRRVRFVGAALTLAGPLALLTAPVPGRVPAARAQPGTAVVVAVGDLSPEPARTTTDDVRTSNLAINANPTLVLPLGDEQYETGTLAKFTSPTGYAQSWGRDTLLARSCPAVGNHEYMDPAPGAPGFFAYFHDRLAACALGPGSRPDVGFYSFDLPNGWHVVVLNSDCRRTDGTGPHCTTSSTQVGWLRSDLARVRAQHKCTLAAFHHPRWGSGYFPDDGKVGPMWTVFQAEHVDVVLNGHEHHYARYGPMQANGIVSASGAGTRQLTIGTGGRSLNPFRRAPHASGLRYRSYARFGILRLALTGAPGGRGTWASEFRGTDGVTVDRATAGCWL